MYFEIEARAEQSETVIYFDIRLACRRMRNFIVLNVLWES